MHILPSASNLLRMSSSAKTQQYATHLRSITDSTLGGSVGSTARSLSLGLSAPGRRFEMSQSCTDKAPQNDKPESPAFCLFGQLHDYLTPWNQKPNKLSSPTTEPVHFCTSQASGRLSGSMDEILPPCLATAGKGCGTTVTNVRPRHGWSGFLRCNYHQTQIPSTSKRPEMLLDQGRIV